MPLVERDSCVNPIAGHIDSLELRDASHAPRGITRRQVTQTAGYTTKDDFGTDGEPLSTPGARFPWIRVHVLIYIVLRRRRHGTQRHTLVRDPQLLHGFRRLPREWNAGQGGCHLRGLVRLPPARLCLP